MRDWSAFKSWCLYFNSGIVLHAAVTLPRRPNRALFFRGFLAVSACGVSVEADGRVGVRGEGAAWRISLSGRGAPPSSAHLLFIRPAPANPAAVPPVAALRVGLGQARRPRIRRLKTLRNNLFFLHAERALEIKRREHVLILLLTTYSLGIFSSSLSLYIYYSPSSFPLSSPAPVK